MDHTKKGENILILKYNLFPDPPNFRQLAVPQKFHTFLIQLAVAALYKALGGQK